MTDTGEQGLVLWEVVQTAQRARQVFRELFATVGLTPTQFGVLACLADGDDFTKAELARALMVRPQSMDPVIDSLLQQGLVGREGEPRRGRAAGITLTEDGAARLASVRPRVTAANDPVRLGLDPEVVGELITQLRTVRDHLPS